jgi:hypothetical protein
MSHLGIEVGGGVAHALFFLELPQFWVPILDAASSRQGWETTKADPVFVSEKGNAKKDAIPRTTEDSNRIPRYGQTRPRRKHDMER